MTISLLIHNFGFMMSALLSLSLGFFVLARGWSKRDHVLYFLTTVAFVFFCVVHVLGANAQDPQLSRAFFILTNIILLLVCFNAHFGFSTFKILKKHRFGLGMIYAVAVLLTLALATWPDLFVLDSRPEQYLPNFLNPGPYYWIFAVFFLISCAYFFVVLASNYNNFNAVDRNRLNYFFLSFGYAYVVGSLQFLPVFGIHFSLLPTALVGLYNIPLAYGLLKYDLLDLHVVARHAMMYFLLVCLVGFSTSGISLLNNFLVKNFEGFPSWPIPFFSGIVIMLTGMLIWKQIRQADVLKYEFINNISHKFRTPLTHIRWLAEELRQSNKAEIRNKFVDQIQYASMRLFELTNAVIDVSEDENNLYLYRFAPVKIEEILRDLFTSHDDLIGRKSLTVDFDVPENLPTVQADRTRIQFALQIVFENSLIYTPEKGKIGIKARQVGGEVVLSFKDNGIGISLDDMEHIFSKFYRATPARRTDTEGMGIGLYMAKNIVEKHRGKIWVESRGEGNGSEFTITLPVG